MDGDQPARAIATIDAAGVAPSIASRTLVAMGTATTKHRLSDPGVECALAFDLGLAQRAPGETPFR